MGHGRPDADPPSSVRIWKIGHEGQLVPVEFNTLVNKLMSSFDWDMVMIGLTGGVSRIRQNVWHSSGGLHLWDPRQKIPATHGRTHRRDL